MPTILDDLGSFPLTEPINGGFAANGSALGIQKKAMPRNRGKKANAARERALAEMAKARAGGHRRTTQYEVRSEGDVFDLVDEGQYAKLVEDRRKRGDFVVDDDGTGYMDDGEEHIFDRRAEDRQPRGRLDRRRKRAGGAGGASKDDAKRTRITKMKGQKKMSKILLDMQKKQAGVSASGRGSSSAVGPGMRKGLRSAPSVAQFGVGTADLESLLDELDDGDSAEKRPPPSALQSIAMSLERGGRTRMRGGGLNGPTPSHPAPAALRGHDAPPEEDVSPPAPRARTGRGDGLTTGCAQTENQEEAAAEPTRLSSKAALLAKARSRGLKKAPAAKITPAQKTLIDQQRGNLQNMVMAEEAPNLGSIGAGGDALGGAQWWASSGIGATSEVGDAPTITAAGLPLQTFPVSHREHAGEQYLDLYWFDLYEDSSARGTLYLFGKVHIPERGGREDPRAYASCCVVVPNQLRTLYFLPREGVDVMDVYKEVNTLLHDMLPKGGANFRCKPVKRRYAFELSDVPRGEATYLKVQFPRKFKAPSSDITGATFSRVFGCNQSGIERFILSRDLMGPQWVRVLRPVNKGAMRSWCKYEIIVDSPKCISKLAGSQPSPPPLKVLSLSLKTVVNSASNAHEIVMASVLVKDGVRVDGPTKGVDKPSEWFTIVRPQHVDTSLVRGKASFPADFRNRLQADRQRRDTLSCEGNERALLGLLVARIHKIDPDVVVGHNIVNFHLDVLLHRLAACRVPHWSKLGRLRRIRMPFLKSGKYCGVLTAGRLLGDTYMSAQEFWLSERNYTLGNLARAHLGLGRHDVEPRDVSKYFGKSGALLNLVRHTENDAWLTLKIMFNLEMLPLTRQITNLVGNLWRRTLTAGRAQRIEYMLCHEFHRLKYVLPDKESFSAKSKLDKKASRSKRRKPAYKGGLVLEPKRGLYDTYILLLDFNSLYPSIIQEYNLCFTTVDRNANSQVEKCKGGAENKEAAPFIPAIPSESLKQGVLPRVIKTLVDTRKVVKRELKKEKEPTKRSQLDCRQKALKIVANSMYGCLGFTGSRFLAKSIAALVTLQGREILQRTVDLVRDTMNLDVIYGDTDSIMIDTRITDLARVKDLGHKIMKEINKMYKLLTIGLDGIFKSMLLLKKKKYAALIIESASSDGKLVLKREEKGLDLVRRDWCPLSKDIGRECLNHILSGRPREEIVESISQFLGDENEKIRNLEVPLDKFVITKGLNKAPQDYSSRKGQPHLLVAIKMQKEGKFVNAGDHIPYVICKPLHGAGQNSSTPFAERAWHPKDVIRQQPLVQKNETSEDGIGPGPDRLEVDIEWYLAQQILPPVSRLVDPIEGISTPSIAEILGLDTQKYRRLLRRGGSMFGDDDDDALMATQIDDKERFRNCERIRAICPVCSSENVFGGVFADPGEDSPPSAPNAAGDYERCGLHCPRPNCTGQFSLEHLSSRVELGIRTHIRKYLDGWMLCDDNTCGHRTRQLSVRGDHCLSMRCRGRVALEYSEKRLYTQLKYYESLFDVDRARKVLNQQNVKRQEQGAPIRRGANIPPALIRIFTRLKEHVANKIREESEYNWVAPSLWARIFT